jgi:hypothetical protein
MGWNIEVPAMRVFTIITSLSLLTALYPPVRTVLQERASRSPLEKLSGDISDRIVETSNPPDRTEKTTIKLGSLEDLAKVAEDAFKPIMHHEGTFHVLDGDVRYEFSIPDKKEETEHH